MNLDAGTITVILGLLAASGVMSKFIVHMSVKPISKQNTEILLILHALTESLNNYKLEQAKNNGELQTRAKCERTSSEIYEQIDSVRDRVSKIEGQLA